jgi:hypothetical protein
MVEVSSMLAPCNYFFSIFTAAAHICKLSPACHPDDTRCHGDKGPTQHGFRIEQRKRVHCGHMIMLHYSYGLSK